MEYNVDMCWGALDVQHYAMYADLQYSQVAKYIEISVVFWFEIFWEI